MIASVEVFAVRGTEHERLARYEPQDREFEDYAALLPTDVIGEQDGRLLRVLSRAFLRGENGKVMHLYVEVHHEAPKAEVAA